MRDSIIIKLFQWWIIHRWWWLNEKWGRILESTLNTWLCSIQINRISTHVLVCGLSPLTTFLWQTHFLNFPKFLCTIFYHSSKSCQKFRFFGNLRFYKRKLSVGVATISTANKILVFLKLVSYWTMISSNLIVYTTKSCLLDSSFEPATWIMWHVHVTVMWHSFATPHNHVINCFDVLSFDWLVKIPA